MENEKIINYYTAESDKDALTLRMFKDIINRIPEEFLEFEMVTVAKIKDELRGIPVSNVILDQDGRQLTIFNFMLRQQLRDEALIALMEAKQKEESEKTKTEN